MSWLLAGLYCGVLWLAFDKLRLLKLSLPVAIVAGAVGPSLIVVLLFCAQYYHPFTSNARVFESVVEISPQLKQPGRVLEVAVRANEPVKKGDLLFRIDPVPYQNTVSQLSAGLDEAKQSRKVADASVNLAMAGLDRANANLKFATLDRDRKADLA